MDKDYLRYQKRFRISSLHLLIIIALASVLIFIVYFISENNPTKIIESGCKDPQQEQLQYDSSRLQLRQKVYNITLGNPQIKKIIDNSYCEFMAEGILYTENGTYQTVNINLNNTKNLVALVSLQNNSVVSYKLLNLTRDYSAK